MGSPKIIFLVLLYVIVTSILIASISVGMGYDGITSGEEMINYTVPDEPSQVPVFGAVSDTGEMLSSLYQAVALVLVWSLPEHFFPLWANIIFIKIPLIYLIVAIVEVILP